MTARSLQLLCFSDILTHGTLFSNVWSFFCQLPSFLLVSSTPASQKGCNTHTGVCSMSTEDNKALVNRYFNAAWNQGNPAVIDDLFAATFHHHNPGVPNGGSREGLQQIKSLFRSAVSLRGLPPDRGNGAEGTRGHSTRSP